MRWIIELPESARYLYYSSMDDKYIKLSWHARLARTFTRQELAQSVADLLAQDGLTVEVKGVPYNED